MRKQLDFPAFPKAAYSVSELALLTGRCARSWWGDIRAGRIRALRASPGRISISHSALMDWIDAHEDSSGARIKEPPAHIRARMEAAQARAAAGSG